MQRKRTYTWNELSGQSSEVNSDNKTDPHVAYFTMKNGLDESLINRELLTKLGALQEMIKNLQDENSFLRSENYRIKSAVSENKSNSIEEKELQAVVFACERFHQYIYGKRVTVFSDHKPLERMKQIKDS